MIPYFPDTHSEAETTADLRSDVESPFDERRRELEMHIAGALARQAEAAGLIHPTDEFSWEWHQEFDNDFQPGQRAAVTAPSSADAEPQVDAAAAGADATVTEGHLGTDLGGTASIGGDFGGGEFGGGL